MSEQKITVDVVDISQPERMMLQRLAFMQAAARERLEMLEAHIRDAVGVMITARGLSGQWQLNQEMTALVRQHRAPGQDYQAESVGLSGSADLGVKSGS